MSSSTVHIHPMEFLYLIQDNPVHLMAYLNLDQIRSAALARFPPVTFGLLSSAVALTGEA